VAAPSPAHRWQPESERGPITNLAGGGPIAGRPDSPRTAAVLFDVDGTLIDSSYLHTLAWWQAFRQAGYDVPMASIHRSVGMGGDRILATLLPADRDTTGDDQIMTSHAAVFSTYWPALRPLDGARDLLARCHDSGLAVALASSARERDLEVLRSTIGADEYIDAATSSSDAKESKPAPDILVAALEALQVPARDAVYVGDAVWDIYAAGKLDIPAIGLTCGGTSAAELRDAGAVEIYESPRALLANLDGSAIGKLAARTRKG
jgi:HAD superfamily hydrolase (TIGR01509 family)